MSHTKMFVALLVLAFLVGLSGWVGAAGEPPKVVNDSLLKIDGKCFDFRARKASNAIVNLPVYILEVKCPTE